MRKSLFFFAVCFVSVAINGCAIFYRAPYEIQQSENQSVMKGDVITAYNIIKQMCVNDGFDITSQYRDGNSMYIEAHKEKNNSEGNKLTGTIFMNMLGGNKATENVVDKYITRRFIHIRMRYTAENKVIQGMIGVVYEGDTIGVNGQGNFVNTTETLSQKDHDVFTGTLEKLIADQYTKKNVK